MGHRDRAEVQGLSAEAAVLLLLNLVWFATLVSVFFATLAGRKERRLKLGLTIWGAMVVGSVVLALLMAPIS
ncbi:MAG: hypothetical protein MUF27_01495 [Acidobacteria bacterium]|nr:hypothetical protein [Acidobacteriota bacterium]